MLEELKNRVYVANMRLRDSGLVIHTWGNVSSIDRDSGVVVIKPSGVDYDKMQPADMVCVSLKTGEIVEGELNPSSDTPTHLELYRAFEKVSGVAHTHSMFATAWAQARSEIPVLGTTHADYFYGPVPCTRPLTESEIQTDYEKNTGRVIVETFKGIDPLSRPAVLVAEHGPFTWGDSPEKSVMHAEILEAVAQMVIETKNIAGSPAAISQHLLDKHYLRKHGKDAHYGQKSVRTQ